MDQPADIESTNPPTMVTPPAPTASMVALPPPPAAAAHRHQWAHRTPRTLRPGAVTSTWATVFWVGWLFVAGGFVAVWNSSRITGLSTWWLGPESAPRLPLHVVPFVAPLVLCVLALRSARFLPWFGIAGAAITAAVALGDLSDQHRYAAVELLLAGGGLLVSVACFAGVLRAAPESAPSGN